MKKENDKLTSSKLKCILLERHCRENGKQVMPGENICKT